MQLMIGRVGPGEVDMLPFSYLFVEVWIFLIPMFILAWKQEKSERK